MTTTSTDRVKFANKIVVTGVEPIDLSTIKTAPRSSNGGLESVYRTICEKVVGLKEGQAWPVALPEGADMGALKRAILGYAAKHFDPKRFKIQVNETVNIAYVYIDGVKPPKKAKAEPAPTPPA